MTKDTTTPLSPSDTELEARARLHYEFMSRRRTIRQFSDRPVPESVIRHLIATAGTAPSGANKQPWRYVAVQDPAIKKEIRNAAEQEERLFYERRATPDFLRDLAPLGTNWEKPFLESAPWLVVVFKFAKDPAADDELKQSDQVYYVNESVGMSVGFFLQAAHQLGLATLTHTPNPMKFLCQVLNRPSYERPYVVIPVGYPSPDYKLPNLQRKPIDQIMAFDRDCSSEPSSKED